MRQVTLDNPSLIDGTKYLCNSMRLLSTICPCTLQSSRQSEEGTASFSMLRGIVFLGISVAPKNLRYDAA